MAIQELLHLEAQETDDPMLPFDWYISEVRYLDFKGRQVAYQVSDTTESRRYDVFVRGYKVSEPYRTADGVSAIQVEALTLQEHAEFQRRLVAKMEESGPVRLHIGYW